MCDAGPMEAIIGDRNRVQKHVARARTILGSADRLSVAEVARRAGIGRPAVWRWQRRFAQAEVDGLLRDATRKPGKAPLGDPTVRRVVALTCAEPPGEATHWTGRALANALAGFDAGGPSPSSAGCGTSCGTRRTSRTSLTPGACSSAGGSTTTTSGRIQPIAACRRPRLGCCRGRPACTCRWSGRAPARTKPQPCYQPKRAPLMNEGRPGSGSQARGRARSDVG